MTNSIPAPIRRLKNRIVPAGARLWRLPLGIGRGLKIYLDLRNWTVLYFGFYEIELNKYIRLLCQPGYDAFDVGGQNGYDALVMAKLTGARVMSFECEQEYCGQMAASFRANEQHAHRIHTYQAFVAHASDPSRGAVTLDEVAYGERGFVPDVIKMDIEGGELSALRGAQRILKNRQPHLIVETHSRELECGSLKLLRAYGYECEIVDARKWLPDNRPSEHNRWLVARGRPKSRARPTSTASPMVGEPSPELTD